MGITELVRTLLEILLSGEGTVILGIAAFVAIATPGLQRYAANRKRVLYRVQHDSRIGLSFDLHDAGDAEGHADPELMTSPGSSTGSRSSSSAFATPAAT